MLGGLDRPASGRVLLDGADLAALSGRRPTAVRGQNTGFVFQSPHLVPALTAQEDVETALVPLGGKAAERRTRAAEALEPAGLGERPGRLPSDPPRRPAGRRRRPEGPGLWSLGRASTTGRCQWWPLPFSS